MHHRLENIAFNRRLDEAKFLAYAEANSDRFKIHNGGVSSWWVDGLVAEYKESVEKPPVVGNSPDVRLA